MKTRITTSEVRKIIKEEIKLFRSLNENESHKAALDHAAAAAKCLDAIEKYVEVVSPKAKSELDGVMDRATQILKRIISSPMNYIDQVQAGAASELVSGNNSENKSDGNNQKVELRPQQKNKKNSKNILN